MTDSEIIWKYLSGLIQDDHLVVYLYCCGQKFSQENAKKKVFDDIYPVFKKAMPDSLLKTSIKAFLDYKKTQYINAEITVKSIY